MAPEVSVQRHTIDVDYLSMLARDNELRERIPVPHDNFLKSI